MTYSNDVLWQPQWQANHAYALLGVVIPTTFTGYTWRCTTAGTTGATEPMWPVDPTVTPTVTDGSVTWSVGTGFRQATQTGVLTLVNDFMAANPTIIRSTFSARPPSLVNVEKPCFFIGDLTEDIVHANGVRTRTLGGFSAYLVDQLGDVYWSNDRMNFAADALVDLFTGGFHAISGRSILEQIAMIDTEFAEGDARFPALEFQFARTFVTEGRN